MGKTRFFLQLVPLLLRAVLRLKKLNKGLTGDIFISQEKDAKNLLNKFNMQNCKAGRRSWDPLYWVLLLLVLY